MFSHQTLLVVLLVWLTALGVAPVVLKSAPPAVSRPEPIEVEPETLTAGSGLADQG